MIWLGPDRTRPFLYAKEKGTDMEIMGFAAGPYQTNCYLVVEGKHVTVVDPGMHTAEAINGYLVENDLELDQIILTHGHIDHTRDAGTLAARHHVPVFIHQSDAFMLKDGAGVSAESQLLFDAFNMTPIGDLRFYGDGDCVTMAGQEFEIRHAPGHSPGSVLLVGQEYCFVGDVVFKGSIGRTDLPQSSPSDMNATLTNVVLELDDTLMLLPGHGPTTSMRAERTTNPYLLQAARN